MVAFLGFPLKIFIFLGGMLGRREQGTLKFLGNVIFNIK